MVAYNQVVNGMSKYIDQEIINKIQGLPKWGLGVVSGIVLSRGTNIFNTLKANPIINPTALTTFFTVRRQGGFLFFAHKNFFDFFE